MGAIPPVPSTTTGHHRLVAAPHVYSMWACVPLRWWELDPTICWAPQPWQTGPHTRLFVGDQDGYVRGQGHGHFGYYMRNLYVFGRFVGHEFCGSRLKMSHLISCFSLVLTPERNIDLILNKKYERKNPCTFVFLGIAMIASNFIGYPHGYRGSLLLGVTSPSSVASLVSLCRPTCRPISSLGVPNGCGSTRGVPWPWRRRPGSANGRLAGA